MGFLALSSSYVVKAGGVTIGLTSTLFYLVEKVGNWLKDANLKPPIKLEDIRHLCNGLAAIGGTLSFSPKRCFYNFTGVSKVYTLISGGDCLTCYLR